MKKADISIICSGMSGGVGTYILNMYNYMRDKGYRVQLVCLEHDWRLLPDNLPESDVFVLPSMEYRTGVSALTEYLNAARPTVLTTPKFRQTIIALRARAALKANTRIYPVIHTAYSADYKKMSPLKRFLRVLRIRHYYPKCDGIICVSAGVADDFTMMTGISEKAMSVIYNPVYSSEMLSKAAQPLEHPWFEKDQPPVVLGVGRLALQKNFQLLIEAFEMVRTGISSRLLILGEGPERENLERRIQDSPFTDDISMPGHVPNPYPYLKRSALLALSSVVEGLPTVLIEALAMGTPVVSTDCPSGPREILMGGEYGQIVPMNSPEKLAEAITNTLENPIPAEILQNRASEFNISASCENYLKLFGFGSGEQSV